MLNSNDEGDLTMLMENEQLKKLALLLRNNEEALMTRAMKSQYERIKYLKNVNDAYDNTITLLNVSTSILEKYAKEDSQDKASIAQDIVDYVKYGINMSLQNVLNCSLRVRFIEKIKTHFDALVKGLSDPEPHNNIDDLQRLAKDVSLYKHCMWEINSKCRSGYARAMSKAYSMLIKEQGFTFSKLVNRHKNKLGIVGDFDGLDDLDKLKVYNSIIENSGRSKVPKLDVTNTPKGVAVLMMIACILVCEIFTHYQNDFTALSDIGDFATSMAAMEAKTTVMVDMKHRKKGQKLSSVIGLKIHTAKIPDGMAFASQIALGS